MIMMVSDFYAAVTHLGLRRTAVAGVFVGTDGTYYNVPHPARYTPEQRARIIEMLTIKVRGYDADLPSSSDLAASARKAIHGDESP
jgi:hypothetical protein